MAEKRSILFSRVFGNRFDAVDIDLDSPNISLNSLGEFDVALFAGVFYHLVDPIAATREVAALVKEVLVLETYVEPGDGSGRPGMIFYPGAELNGDASNWWGPNVECIVALLKKFGFSNITVKGGSGPSRKVFHARRL